MPPVCADDGVFQEGGVLVHFPDQQEWTAIFLEFQSQSWHTDDKTGHSVTGPVPPRPLVHRSPRIHPPPPTRMVSSVSSQHLSIRHSRPEVEIVTLLNTAPHDVSLSGWALLDTQKKRLPLSEVLSAGATRSCASASRSLYQTRAASSRWWMRADSRCMGCLTRRSRHAIPDGRLRVIEPGGLLAALDDFQATWLIWEAAYGRRSATDHCLEGFAAMRYNRRAVARYSASPISAGRE